MQVNISSPMASPPQPLQPPIVATPSPVQAPVEVAAAAVVSEPFRDTDSPGTIRPFPTITDFIEDPSANFGTPERVPSPPKAAITDLLRPKDAQLIRPSSCSPLDSEAEDEQENTRLVSIEEFLRQDQETTYGRRQQVGGANTHHWTMIT